MQRPLAFPRPLTDACGAVLCGAISQGQGGAAGTKHQGSEGSRLEVIQKYLNVKRERTFNFLSQPKLGKGETGCLPGLEGSPPGHVFGLVSFPLSDANGPALRDTL